MRAIDIAIFAGWIVFWVYWLIAAGGVKKGRVRWGRFAAARVLIAVVVFVLIRFKVLGGPASVQKNMWLGGVGLAVFVCGLAFAVWARVYIGENWGMPMTEKVDAELVTTGPYGRVRHPIYSGIILGLLGTSIALNWYMLVVLALIGGYFVYSAVMEERYMTKRFPEGYPSYKASTKMLIPFLL